MYKAPVHWVNFQISFSILLTMCYRQKRKEGRFRHSNQRLYQSEKLVS